MALAFCGRRKRGNPIPRAELGNLLASNKVWVKSRATFASSHLELTSSEQQLASGFPKHAVNDPDQAGACLLGQATGLDLGLQSICTGGSQVVKSLQDYSAAGSTVDSHCFLGSAWALSSTWGCLTLGCMLSSGPGSLARLIGKCEAAVQTVGGCQAGRIAVCKQLVPMQVCAKRTDPKQSPCQ